MNKLYFFVKYQVPVLIIAGIIFYLSSQPSLGSWMSNPLETILRKGAHFTEYALLTLFLWRLFFNGWKFSLERAFIFSLLLAILYAGFDELHQSFVEGRNGSWLDVIVDFFSAFVVLQMALFFIKRKMKNIILAIVGAICFIGVVSLMIWQSYKELKVKNHVAELQNIEPVNERDKENENNLRNDSEVVGSIKEENQTIDKKNNSKSTILAVEHNLSRQKDEALLKKVQNKVPFMVQSPFAKWDELHEEACEEASLIMLKYYNNILFERPGLLKILTRERAEEEIQKLVKYQIEKYGDFHDTDMQTTKEIGEEYFKLDNLKIIVNFSITDLKKELAQGNIILIPTAGRELKNPYFTAPGPLYHNLVITGYDDSIDSKTGKQKSIFITNDPGTRRGENYKYNQQILYNAIHDFGGDKNKILEGEKKAIVLVGIR